jgi:alkylation response protein AidB-like acyl-CoA dehydrogenase
VNREIFESEHDELRAMARAFVKDQVEPRLPEWEAAGEVDRDLFAAAGELGLLGFDVAEEYGGGGVDDFRYNVVLNEELTRVGATSVVMNLCGFNDLIAPYLVQLCSEEQKSRWLPGLCAGRSVAAIAMTEPGAGSDLKAISTTAVPDGDGYVLNGAKTFISNGILADVVVVAAKTDPSAGSRGISLLVVERGMPGFERGRRLHKIGLAAQDTAELFFDGVRVPRANLLGEEGAAFGYLMRNLVRERMSVSVTAVASMRRALDEALAYTGDRRAFGQRIADFQAIKFTLAELATEVEVAQVFLDRCIAGHVRDELSEVEAAMCKWWVTELQQRVITRALQLHGGYGFMREYGIAREFMDARASTLYAGTTEIMKEIIGRSLVRGG